MRLAGRESGMLTEDDGRELARRGTSLVVLPVHGVWWHRSGAAELVLSGHLRADPTELDPVLRPIIQALA